MNGHSFTHRYRPVLLGLAAVLATIWRDPRRHAIEVAPVMPPRLKTIAAALALAVTVAAPYAIPDPIVDTLANPARPADARETGIATRPRRSPSTRGRVRRTVGEHLPTDPSRVSDISPNALPGLNHSHSIIP